MKRIRNILILFIFLLDPFSTALLFGASKAFGGKKPPSAEEIQAQAEAKKNAAARKGIEDSQNNRKQRRKLVNPTGGLGLSGPANVQRRELLSA